MTALIPRPFIDELLNRTDLVELIDSYIPLKKRGNSHLACCPFHQEKTPSFNVVSKKQFYHCFGCGASGNAISFIMNYLNQGFVDAIETLASRIGMQIPREESPTTPKQSPSLYKLLEKVASFYHQRLKTTGTAAIQYLKNRGVSGEIAKQYQIGYAPEGWNTLETQFKADKKDLITTGMLIVKDNGNTYDRYRHRITFPIHDRHGRIIGFGGRSIDPEQKPKYLNSPETALFQKSRELYGLHQVIEDKNTVPNILVVEGYMDVIALAQFGVTNAVATLGTATSSFHIQLLSKHTNHIIFCFDGDEAGRQAAWRALESSLSQLTHGLAVHFTFLPDTHDPDSLIREEGKEAFLQRLQRAIPLNDFFFSSLSKAIELSSMSGKSQLILAAKPYLQKMAEGPYKQLMLDELARITRMEPHRLQQVLTDKVELKAQEPSQSITRTPLRVAIALVLQNPHLFTQCQEQIDIDLLDDPKQALLQSILRTISENPAILPAPLIEIWRDSPYFDALNKLATWEHQVAEDVLVKELLDIVLFLIKQNQENKIQQFLEKARIQGLTDEERLELQTMLRKRHTTH